MSEEGSKGEPSARGGWLRRSAKRLAALPVWIRLAGGVLVLAAVSSLVLFVGFEIGKRKFFPYRWLDRIDRSLIAQLKQPRKPVAQRSYTTALLRLDTERGRIDIEGPAGGALASFGDDVLVLTFDGRIYAAASASDIRQTRIVAPENEQEKYEALATDPAFEALKFYPRWIRYNDLLHYDSAAGRGLVASYTEFHPERACVTNTLARLEIDRGTVSVDDVEAGEDDWTVFFRTEPCLPFKEKYAATEGHMAGGKLAFEPPSTLYLTSGDYHLDGMRSDGPAIAQDPEAHYGKVLAVDLLSGEGRIVSMGHRNPQGLVLTREGQLVAAEHGPRGGDELNLIAEGANFGWPLESYGTTYRLGRIPGSLSFGRHDRFTAPIFSWVPSPAISAIEQIDGFHEAWDGDLLVASLGGRKLFRVRMQGSRGVYSEEILIKQQLRDVHQHTDGRIALWTDGNGLLFLSAAELRDSSAQFDEFLLEGQLAGPQIAAPQIARLRTAVERCAECHSFEVDDHARSPSLKHIFGERIAATPYAGYSEALRSRGGHWERDELAGFLTDPQAFAPGTSMADPEISDPEVLGALIDFLEFVDGEF